MTSSPWEMGSNSFEKRLLGQSSSNHNGWEGYSRQKFAQRSSSADTHSRGRSVSAGTKRSASRPRQLDLSKAQILSRRGDSSSPFAHSTKSTTDSASRSSTSRSRSRARETLQEIAAKEGKRDASPHTTRHEGVAEEKLWWQRGRR
jgi:hypothetical protein